MLQIHVFQGDHTNLYKFIPKEILPSDFGGNAPPMEESNSELKDFYMGTKGQVFFKIAIPGCVPSFSVEIKLFCFLLCYVFIS